jgi:hypothetical protein
MCYLEDFFNDEDVFRFDITMENAIAMHVVHGYMHHNSINFITHVL